MNMNNIKEQLSYRTSLNEDKNKTRNRDKYSVHCIENLSNEIFLEIFEYLEGCSLYEAFSNLNARFQHLLTDSSLRFNIVLVSNSKSTLEHYSKNVIIPNRHQIISLHFNNTNDTSPILSWLTNDSAFNRLESITITGIQTNDLTLHLQGLSQLPRLFYLTMHLGEHSNDIGDIYQSIFSLPKLKYNKFSSRTFHINMDSLKANPSQFSSIEYLIIDYTYLLNDLITILSYTPRLSHLVSKGLLRAYRNNPQIQPMTLSNLTHLDTGLILIGFDLFEIFIMPISSQLRVLKLCVSTDTNYLNADRWESLIVHHIPHLHKFKLTVSQNIGNIKEVTPHHERLNRFTSAFWIEKQWLLHCTIRSPGSFSDSIIYEVSSCSNLCAEFHNYKTNNEYITNGTDHNSLQHESFVPSILCNTLFISDLPNTKPHKSFFDSIRPVLLVSAISAVSIKFEQIPNNMLIEWIHSLPNLISLSIQSLMLVPPECLSNDEKRALLYVLDNNNIIKLRVQLLSEFAQIKFLIGLCSRMQHLEVTCSKDMNPESILRFIFLENVICIPDLSLLCLRISELREETIENFKKIIGMNKLRPDYTIQHTVNEIYLRRN